MIGIITYDNPHRKTQELIAKLILNGYPDIHIIATPWVERKNFQPLFKHRPAHCENISTEVLAERFNISYTKVDTKDINEFLSQNAFHHVLIGGAGILPEELALNHKIINSHPGYLPNVRGLDAFKWAIYHGQPIGVTSHYISDKADEGELIERREIPVYFEDTFHSVAYRVYETEVEMLVNAIKLIESNQATFESLTDDRFEATRRMPHHYEIVMMERFEALRKKSEPQRKLKK